MQFQEFMESVFSKYVIIGTLYFNKGAVALITWVSKV